MTTKIIQQNGGKVIASGGFGCIFKPALKCENETNNSEPNNTKITKLMTVKNATQEYNQIQKFKTVLQTIPNYNNYFLFKDIILCKPNKLTKNDLYKYKKCKTLKKKGINAKNINNSLDKVLALNMQDGGIDVDKFIYNYYTSTNIIKLNNSLIHLLVEGIVPMNKLNVYHCDIKDGNVLVKNNINNLETRLIDWGLSFIHNPNTTQGIHKNMYRRPFQYNVPFSSVLFNKEFLKRYYKFLDTTTEPNYFQIREFVINYIFIWNNIRGPGHLSAINDIIKKLTIKDLSAIQKTKIKEHFVEYEFTYYYIVEYLSKILEKYTKNGNLELMTYFNTVFLKNIDIWGFVMIYIVLYEYFYDNFDTLDTYQLQLINKIKYIIIHFLYENPIEPIDISSLTSELTSLNPILEKININTRIFNKPKTKTKTQTRTKRGKKISKKQTNKTRKSF